MFNRTLEVVGGRVLVIFFIARKSHDETMVRLIKVPKDTQLPAIFIGEAYHIDVICEWACVGARPLLLVKLRQMIQRSVEAGFCFFRAIFAINEGTDDALITVKQFV